MLKCNNLITTGVVLVFGLLVGITWFHMIKDLRLVHTANPAPAQARREIPSTRCSFETFRRLAEQRNNYTLSGSGEWTMSKTLNKTDPHSLEKYQPDICSFTYGNRLPYDVLKTCFSKKKIKHIVIFGDSNGGRAYMRLLKFLQISNRSVCAPYKIYPRLTGHEYNTTGAYLKHYCRCNGTARGLCTYEFVGGYGGVAQSRCDFDDTFSVIVESVTMQQPWDRPFSHRTGCQVGDGIFSTKAASSQEFLLAEFLTDPRPDIILLFADAHDSSPLEQYNSTLDKLAEVIERYVQPPTRFIWLSRIAEDITKKPEPWRSMRYQGGTMSRLQYTDASNRIAYRKLGKRFVETGKPLMFLDLYPMTVQILKDFNIDGVHMHDAWYQALLSFVLQTVCDV